MECIPAIDLKGGTCVRLTQGKFEQQNLYSDDPLTIAKRWVNEGARRLHIVDLDGARMGAPNPQHLVIVRDIMRRLQVPVQLGGGIRNRDIVERVLGMGVDRAIIGTAALEDPLVGDLFSRYGEHIVVGVNARDGMVAVQGWVETTQMPAIAFAQEMERRGALRIVFTDISRDGMLEGVNVRAVREMIGAVSIPVIAAGGVSTVQDIVNLKALGAEAAILGKALYENALRLPVAIAAAEMDPGRVGADAPRGAQPQAHDGRPAAAPAPSEPPRSGPAKPYLPWADRPPKR